MLIDKTIAIAALARDCEKSLRHNIPRIERLRSYFKSSAVVVVENDSKDRTKDFLFEWKRSAANVKILSQDFNTRTIPAKTAECPFPGMNTSERSIRPFVIGRKNWMFYKSPDGAHSGCALYSLIESAKLNNLDPTTYLRRVFSAAPLAVSTADWENLLPWNCK